MLSEGLLQQIVRRLVAEFDPERIILFGSHAWGAPDANSDVDLMVIVAESDERPIARDRRAHLALSGLGIAKDVLVQTRAEVELLSEAKASLEHKVLSEGRLLYERRDATVDSAVAREGTG